MSRVDPMKGRHAECVVDAARYFPTRWRPVHEGFAGAGSRFWLRGPANDGDVEYTVLEADGVGITRITVPEPLRMLWADHTTVWAEERDQYDAPTVVRFTIEPLASR